jgi:hypothetical protein
MLGEAAIGPSAACDPLSPVITPPVLQLVIKVLDIAEVVFRPPVAHPPIRLQDGVLLSSWLSPIK